jgi:hypothetical protein
MQFELPIPENVGFMLKNACDVRTKRFEHRIGVVWNILLPHLNF